MIKPMTSLSMALLLLGLAGTAAPPAHADNLLLQRVREERGMHLPARGLTMAQVERRYGAPLRRLAPRGGGSARQPVIHRWEYSDYIVYFDRDRVIHSVLNTPAGNNTDPQAVH